jgi:hypothetical protein
VQITAEIRWFWPATLTAAAGVQEWFNDKTLHGTEAGAGVLRRDVYYLQREPNVELGIKVRDADETSNHRFVEIKGYFGDGVELSEPFDATAELWSKVRTDLLAPTAECLPVHVKKQRWMRRFDMSTMEPVEMVLNEKQLPVDLVMPSVGCDVELTRVELGEDEVWWTFGFESYGVFEYIEQSLLIVLEQFSELKMPVHESMEIASYPQWIKNRIADGTVCLP